MIVAYSKPSEDLALRAALDARWKMASTDELIAPTTVSGLPFLSAKVPGTIASALRHQKAWHIGDRVRFVVSKRRWSRCPNTATVESGGQRRIVLRPLQFGEAPARIAVMAVNADGRFAVAV